MGNYRVVQEDNAGNPIQRVAIGNAEYQVDIDQYTSSMKGIRTEHYEIHNGTSFMYSIIVESIANDGNLNLVVQTGAKELHMDFSAAGGGDFYAYLYEAPSYDTDGTPVSPVARNRGHSLATTVILLYDPTISNAGTELLVRYVPGGVLGRAIGDVSAEREEIILAANTDYLMRITNKSGLSKTFNLDLSWYEVEI